MRVWEETVWRDCSRTITVEADERSAIGRILSGKAESIQVNYPDTGGEVCLVAMKYSKVH